MSRITIEVGTATIDVRPETDYASVRGSFATYRPTDVIYAAIKALRAVGTDEADRIADLLGELPVNPAAKATS